MKKKIMITAITALMLISLISLFQAGTASANPSPINDYEGAVRAAADRLVALQSSEDNGWDGVVTGLTEHSDNLSGSNLYGVTALGLLDAYELTDNLAYLDAAKKVADMMVDYGEDYASFKDAKLGQSFDLRFLMRFAEISGDTAYNDFAENYWNWVKAREGPNVYADGNQENFYQFYINYPLTPSFATWQSADFGLAALVMGDTEWADNMAEVVSNHLAELADNDDCRIIGWGHALEFLHVVDNVAYAENITYLIDCLKDNQDSSGRWYSGNEEGAAQDIGYAVMGLVAANELESAKRAADWLVENQDPNGGWVDGNEYSESDSEAIQALFDVIQAVGTVQNIDTGINYITIQAAIDAADEGDTVLVHPGTYKEHIVIDKSNLSLIGENRETTIIDATHNSSWTVEKPGILIGEYPLVDGVYGVTVSGFTIRDAAMQEDGSYYGGTASNVGPQAITGILIYNSDNNVIENNILVNNHWQIFVCAEWAAVGYTSCRNNRIANNIIRDSEQDGVYLYSDGSVFLEDTEIINNEISNAYGENASGVDFWGWKAGETDPAITGTIIRNNDITNCTYGIRLREGVSDITGTLIEYNNISDSDGILVRSTNSIAILNNTISNFNKFGIVAENVLSVQIEGNIISTTNHTLAPNGIQIGYEIDPTATTGSVSNNIISGCYWDGYDPETQTYEDNWTGSGILVIAPNSTLTISGNEVRDSDVGLDIEAGSGTLITNNDVRNNNYGFVLWNAHPTINYNNIYQNGLCGVYRTSDLTGTLDATLNWWGDPSGPSGVGLGSGDAVSANVDYTSWLDAIGGEPVDYWSMIADLKEQVVALQETVGGQATEIAALTDLIAELQKNLETIELTPGPKGDTGDTGAKGDTGDTGPMGPAGPAGAVPLGIPVASAVFMVIAVLMLAYAIRRMPRK